MWNIPDLLLLIPGWKKSLIQGGISFGNFEAKRMWTEIGKSLLRSSISSLLCSSCSIKKSLFVLLLYSFLCLWDQALLKGLHLLQIRFANRKSDRAHRNAASPEPSPSSHMCWDQSLHGHFSKKRLNLSNGSCVAAKMWPNEGSSWLHLWLLFSALKRSKASNQDCRGRYSHVPFIKKTSRWSFGARFKGENFQTPKLVGLVFEDIIPELQFGLGAWSIYLKCLATFLAGLGNFAGKRWGMWHEYCYLWRHSMLNGQPHWESKSDKSSHKWI